MIIRRRMITSIDTITQVSIMFWKKKKETQKMGVSQHPTPHRFGHQPGSTLHED